MKEKKVGEYITYAVFELLKSNSLSDITVTEIIKKAGVCRSSFYRNFYLPEDVIRRYGLALLESIDERTPLDPKGVREHILAFNASLWTQKERLTLLEKQGLFYLLEDSFMAQCKRQILRLGGQRNRYHADFLAGATYHLMRAWIRNGFEESPEEITDLIIELFTK